MFKELLQKLKEGLAGGEEADSRSAPVVNERMARISSGETFSGQKRKLQNLSGGSRSLTPDQIRAIRHEGKRQKQERDAEAAVAKLRAKLGRQRLERIAGLSKVFAPAELAALRKEHPSLTDADLAPLEELLPMLDRDLCDDLARLSSWGENERQRLLAATPEPQRVRLGEAAAAVLARQPQLLREQLLRLDRHPAPKSLEALVLELRGLVARDALVAAAEGLAQLAKADLPRFVQETPKPTKGKVPAKR